MSSERIHGGTGTVNVLTEKNFKMMCISLFGVNDSVTIGKKWERYKKRRYRKSTSFGTMRKKD